MSMSTFVYGFKPVDEKWHKMRAVWDTGRAAGIPMPEEVSKFFEGEEPDEAGVMAFCLSVETYESTGSW